MVSKKHFNLFFKSVEILKVNKAIMEICWPHTVQNDSVHKGEEARGVEWNSGSRE